MRFLLQSSKTKNALKKVSSDLAASEAKLVHPNVVTRQKFRSPSSGSHQFIAPSSCRVSLSPPDKKSVEIKNVLWGQKCSKSCGCAVRFEVDVNDSDTVVRARYTAKTLVSSSKKTTGKFEENIIPTVTSKGRPIMTKCQCGTLRTLSEKVSSIVIGQKLRVLKNSVEFSGPRSPLSFRHTVLRLMGFSSTDGHCLDLVEEAFAAMVVGRMIPPRKKPEVVSAGLDSIKVFETLPNRGKMIPRNWEIDPSWRPSFSYNFDGNPMGDEKMSLQIPTIFRTSFLKRETNVAIEEQTPTEQEDKYKNIAYGMASSSFPSLYNNGYNGVGNNCVLDWEKYVDEQLDNESQC